MQTPIQQYRAYKRQQVKDMLKDFFYKHKVIIAIILIGLFIGAGISDQIALEQGLISCHNYSPIALV